jgi:UDP-N-acetylglucosamine 2-epimerase (non-hydrolysing)
MAKRLLPIKKLIDPLDYEPFTNLMSQCYLALTDLGGIQEGVPALWKLSIKNSC